MMKCLEVSPKVLALRNPAKESRAAFSRRAADLHNALCPAASPEDVIEVSPGVSLPRKIVEGAKALGDYMDLHHPGPWKLCGIQRREP